MIPPESMPHQTQQALPSHKWLWEKTERKKKPKQNTPQTFCFKLLSQEAARVSYSAITQSTITIKSEEKYFLWRIKTEKNTGLSWKFSDWHLKLPMACLQKHKICISWYFRQAPRNKVFLDKTDFFCFRQTISSSISWIIIFTVQW